jgi:hypothetical protein
MTLSIVLCLQLQRDYKRHFHARQHSQLVVTVVMNEIRLLRHSDYSIYHIVHTFVIQTGSHARLVNERALFHPCACGVSVSP